MKKLLFRRVLIAACALLAVLFVARPSASSLRDRVTHSIGAALGRNVEISSLHLRFLPRPGFEIENLIIHDDARFGAEPLVRAPDVTASLQVGALLKGHIQIARLSLSDASLNLTRNGAGEWNIADLLERTSTITMAPTAASRRSLRPAFPYIEATGTRVNFKIGAEKTHFALTDAKFAVWQDSENAWGMRLQAQPIRTDANLTDTGLVAMSGTWQRSATLRETPLRLSFEWKRAQLGQITKFVGGYDRGWRGGVALSGGLVGTPDNLKIVADASVDDFRGPDVLAGNDLRLASHCSGEYSLSARTVSNLDCVGPSGNGVIDLKGSVAFAAGQWPFSNYDFRISATEVPAQSILMFARHAKASLAGMLTADGQANAIVHLSRSDPGPALIEGGGEIQDLRLLSSSSGQMIVGTVPFVVGGASQPGVRQHAADRKRKNDAQMVISADQPQVEIGPFDLSMGKAGSLQIHGLLSRSGYEGSIRGEARVRQLLQAAHIAGIPAPAFNADGNSSVDVNVTGDWNGDRPKVTGTAQLRSVNAQVRGVNGSINISKASLVLSDDAVKVSNLTATAADSTWHGSLRIPRPCPVPRSCTWEFNLRTPQLTAAALNAYLNPAAQKKSWYRFLDLRQDQPRYLLQARAAGTILVEKLILGKTVCSEFTSSLHLEEGRISLSHLSGEVLGGVVSGEWGANFDVNPPEFRGSGDAQGISLAEVSELMNDGWIDGSGGAQYQFVAAGRSLRELLDSADLNATFSVVNGSFPHIAFTKTSGPLRAQNFSGSAQLRAGEISLRDAKLETAGGVYTVSGTSSLDGVLNLRVVGEGAPGYLVSGTILQTRVVSSPTTAASLKP